MNTQIEKRGVLEAIKEARPQFEGRLPKGITVDQFTFGLATAVQKNPKLLDCDPKSVLLAAYEAAELGISLSPSLALGWLIPYGNQAQFQASYRAFIQKAYETGLVRAFYAECVFRNDKFERQYAPKRNLFHAPGDGDRGEVIGVYALIEYADGAIDYEYLTEEQVQVHRKHSKQPDSLMWKTFPDEGRRKTSIRVLFKRIPMRNPGMQRLAEIVNTEAERDLETIEPGKVELDENSPLSTPASKPQASTETPATEEAVSACEFEVGTEEVTIWGNTRFMAVTSRKLKAKPIAGGKWTMPASMAQELLEACDQLGIPCIESKEQGSLL